MHIALRIQLSILCRRRRRGCTLPLRALTDELSRQRSISKFTTVRMTPNHHIILPHLCLPVDTAHVVPLAFIASTPAKYCYRAIATFIKHVTNMPPTAALQRHRKPPVPLRPSSITPETVASPIASLPLGGDRPEAPLQGGDRSPPLSKGFASSFRRGSSFFSKSPRSHSDFGNTENKDAIDEDVLAGDPIVYYGGWVSANAQPPR